MSQRPQEAPHGPDADGLTERQRRALAALLAAPTATEAAQLAGVGERTMKRFRALPAFQRAYRAAQADLVENAVCQSRQHLTGALSALADITADETAPPAARVSAARASIEMALKLGEQSDILQRIEELEKSLGGRTRCAHIKRG